MLLITTVNPILHSQLQHTLTEAGNPFLLLKERENIVDSVN